MITVDNSAWQNQKVCKWNEVSGQHVICDAKDNTGQCSGNQCSNSNTNLAKYAMCPSSPVCGTSNLFMEKHANLSVEFTNPN